MGNNIVGHVLADLYVACFSWGIEQWIKKKTEEEFLGSLQLWLKHKVTYKFTFALVGQYYY